MIIMIAAAAENNALGKNNELLWHLPDDFKRFKQLTSHHHIIMGRKTFESIGRLLPNRTNIVISRQKDLTLPEGVLKVNSDLSGKKCDAAMIGLSKHGLIKVSLVGENKIVELTN